MANKLNCDIIESKSEFQSCYNVHFFRLILIDKVWHSLPLPALDLIAPIVFFYMDGFGIK